jgi:chromosome segregation ATPase
MKSLELLGDVLKKAVSELGDVKGEFQRMQNSISGLSEKKGILSQEVSKLEEALKVIRSAVENEKRDIIVAIEQKKESVNRLESDLKNKVSLAENKQIEMDKAIAEYEDKAKKLKALEMEVGQLRIEYQEKVNKVNSMLK